MLSLTAASGLPSVSNRSLCSMPLLSWLFYQRDFKKWKETVREEKARLTNPFHSLNRHPLEVYQCKNQILLDREEVGSQRVKTALTLHSPFKPW